MAARAVQGDLQPVAGGGDGPLAETDLPRVHPGVAVHRDDRADPFQRPALDGVGGAAGQHLLGGLEDQPDGARQQALLVQFREDEAGAEDHGGVHVVAAGVRPVGHGRAVRALGLGVGDGQAVDVGPQGEHAGPSVPLLARHADVTDEPGSDVEYARLEAGPLEPLLDRGCRAELLVAQLRVHVQVAPERDELGAQSVGQRTGKHGSPGKIDLGLQ